jgi:tRNA pseudouridine38-40 synthase
MRKLRLIIEYDGTRFVGWQRQENGISIQGEIERAFKEMLQEDIDVVGAGRTDAGVHARGQTAHLKTGSKLPTAQIMSGLNALLPDDIIVLDISEADSDFHARYSAISRQYSYQIIQIPTALMRNYSWYVKYPLDTDLLRLSAEKITGEHDFKSFCKSGSDVDNFLCNVTESWWNIDQPYLRYTISANRFLRGMVRAVVGTMVDVARGYTPIDDFGNILNKKNRCEAGASAPAKGLTLERVLYSI